MKKLSRKQRELDVAAGHLARSSERRAVVHGSTKKKRKNRLNNGSTYRWFVEKCNNGLNAKIRGNRVTITLPKDMNFSKEYEKTMICLMAIRKLVNKGPSPVNSLTLRTVSFGELEAISTSAALVLTAELAKWDDASRRKLRPVVGNWNDDIFSQFSELGFFDLFTHKPDKSISDPKVQSDKRLVKYIKGKLKEHSKTRLLRDKLREIVGQEIDNWAFLHEGLVEAIVNVSHHAYPPEATEDEEDKYWYLTGSFEKSTRQLKIVFYDQGITIPGSLPATKIGEKVLKYVSQSGLAKGYTDATLLKAAVEMSRTRTDDSDRGHGLQDILKFVKQRHQGYLAVVSRRGIFRLDVELKSEKTEGRSRNEPLKGTLIVWNVTLEG